MPKENSRGCFISFAPSISYNLKSENLKKLYIPYIVGGIRGLNRTIKETIVITQVYSPEFVVSVRGGGWHVFASEMPFKERDWINNREIYFANMYYYFNYEGAPNKNYYWIDIFHNPEQKHLDPENPIRAGYEFEGWYLEPECETLWDGTKPSSVYEDVRVYAGWKKIQAE